MVISGQPELCADRKGLDSVLIFSACSDEQKQGVWTFRYEKCLTLPELLRFLKKQLSLVNASSTVRINKTQIMS